MDTFEYNGISGKPPNLDSNKFQQPNFAYLNLKVDFLAYSTDMTTMQNICKWMGKVNILGLQHRLQPLHNLVSTELTGRRTTAKTKSD